MSENSLLCLKVRKGDHERLRVTTSEHESPRMTPSEWKNDWTNENFIYVSMCLALQLMGDTLDDNDTFIKGT